MSICYRVDRLPMTHKRFYRSGVACRTAFPSAVPALVLPLMVDLFPEQAIPPTVSVPDNVLFAIICTPFIVPPRVGHADQNEQDQQDQKRDPPVHRRKVRQNK